MGALTLTASANPAILSENYINRSAYDAGAITATDGEDFIQRLYDGVLESKYATLISNDSTPEVLEGCLYYQGAQVTRQVDFIAALGHNLKSWKIELSSDNGATWPVVYSCTNDTTANKLISISSPVDANRWRLTMNTVQSGTQKEVGELIIALASGQLSVSYAEPPDVSYEQTDKTAKLADGSKRYALIDRADTGHEFYRASCLFHGLSTADRELLADMRKSTTPVLWMPWPGDSQAEIYLGRMVPNSYHERYTDVYRSLGWTISFEFEELGGS